MKALIAFYSQSGCTAVFARKILETFRNGGIECDIELIKPIGKMRPGLKDIEFKGELPDLSGYDLLLLGGPVWAMTINPPLRLWVKRFADLTGKKAALFITLGLPFAGVARGAIKAITEVLENRDAEVLGSAVQPCFFIVPEKAMQKAAENLLKTVQGN